MIYIFQKLAILTVGLTASLTAVNVSAIAATINYDIKVSIDSGPLLDETYLGSFSFDNDSLTRDGSEFVEVFDLEFGFLNVDYSQADDSDASAEFLDSDFLGLNFSTDTFAFAPGFFNVNEAFFSYEIDRGAGAGDINYSLQTVPEPTLIISILLLGIFGATSLLKRSRK